MARTLSVAMTVLLPVIVAHAYAESRKTTAIPRKTGNLSILSYRKPLLEGKNPTPLDPLLGSPAKLRRQAITSVEDYVTFDVIAPSESETNFAPHLANAEACRRLGIAYAIYPWVHFSPGWIEKQPEFVAYANLEDGSTCRQPSGWAPHTVALVERFYKLMAKHLGKHISAVYATDCAEYGELGYPNGYTKWLRKDDNAKVAWWCGDKYAREDFRRQMLERYGKIEEINRQWGTSFKAPADIAYPPLGLIRKNPDPRKLSPQQRRWALDFVYFYQDASPRRMKTFIRIAQTAFPGRPCEVKLGHASESAVMGHSYSSACRILKGTPRLTIRSTHASVSYFHVKRVATPAHFHGFDLLTEPPGNIKPDRMAERIFTDACVGVTAYFDYPQNPPAAGEAYNRNIGLLDGKRAVVDVALLFPEADHYLRIDKSYPDGLLACANAVRDVVDYDVVDERLIVDGALDRYAILVMVGDPLVETSTWRRLAESGRRDRPLIVLQVVEKHTSTPVGHVMCVDGNLRTFAPTGAKRGSVRRITDKPGGKDIVSAIQTAYADVLTERGLKKDTVTMLTRQDGLWTGLFQHRILVLNTTGTAGQAIGQAIPAGQIIEIDRAGRQTPP